MRGAPLAVVVVLAIVATTVDEPSAVARVAVRPPTIDWVCQGLARAPLLKCVQEHSALFVSEPASGVLLFKDTVFQYAFVLDATGHARFSGKYALAMTVAVTSSESVTVDGLSARRVDLRTSQRLDTARSDVLLRHHAIMCHADTCVNLTVECSRVRDGRAIEAFLGHVAAQGNHFTVEGDRSQQLACR